MVERAVVTESTGINEERERERERERDREE
jgi:hypothetical protein